MVSEESLKPGQYHDRWGMAMRIVSILIVLGMMVGSLSIVSDSEAAPVQGWQTPTMLQPVPNYAHSSAMGMDDQGNAIVVWVQYSENYSTSELWATRYDNVSGWQTGEILWNDTWWSSNATIAVSPNGQAVIAWYSDIPAGNLSLYALFYDPLLGWGTPEIVDSDPYFAMGDLTVDIDTDGNALIVSSAAAMGEVAAYYYDTNTSWSSDVISLIGGRWPSVRFDDFGYALALWNNFSASRVESSRFSPITGWGPVEIADGGIGGSWAQMDGNESGCAVATFDYYDGYNGTMYGNIYDPSSGWGVPTLIGPANGGWDPFGGYVAHGATGEFFVVWDQMDEYAGTGRSPWSVIWSESSGWSAPTKLNTMVSTGYGMNARIAANANGEAMAVWTEGNETIRYMTAARYTPASGWGSPVVIKSSQSIDAWYDGVAMSANGNAIAFWNEYDGSDELLWGSAYLAEEGPPLSISQPVNGEVFTSPTAVVMGTTDPNASLVVNGLIVAVELDGSFEINVALVPGINEIWARATNESGTTGASVMVEYIEIVPDLNQQIADLMNQISLLSDQMNQSNAELTNALAEIASLTANLSAYTDIANQTFAEFNQTMAELEMAQNEIANLSTDLEMVLEQYWLLQDELNTSADDFALTMAQLNSTYSMINSTMSELNQTNAALATMIANYGPMADFLAAFAGNFSGNESSLWDLANETINMQNQLSESRDQLNSTREELSTSQDEVSSMKTTQYILIAAILALAAGLGLSMVVAQRRRRDGGEKPSG